MDPAPSTGALSSSKVTRRRALLGIGGGLAAGLLSSASPRGTGATGTAGHDSHAEASPAPLDTSTDEPRVREFELVAEEFDYELMPGMTTRAWGYNGQTPGPEIRATEGDLVRVTLRNRLSVPTTVHWHGIHLRPEMDGPAGLNQAAVPPGESFTYEFVATPAGTRWYHSHADPALQVPMGLYGPLVIEPKKPARTYDREYTLMLAEWDSELTPDVAAGRAERGPRDRQMRGGELGSDMFLLNGRAHGGIPPIVVREGERVLLRMINAGHMPHPIHMHGHSFRIVATDGNPVPQGMEWTKDTALIGPAERYDLEFDANNPGVWMFHCHIEHHMANGMMTVIQYKGHQPTGPAGDVMAVAMGHEPEPHDHDTGHSTTPTPVATTTDGADSLGAEVTLVDDRFEPVELTISRSTTVTWTNKGADWHSLEAYDGSFSSGKLAPGESYAYTFEQAGTFQYICNHHGLQGMIGQVVVTGG